MSERNCIIYRPNPYQSGAFQLFKTQTGQEEIHIGDYILLDQREDEALTERKMVNLVALLNGRQEVMDLSTETNSRLLYQVLSPSDNGAARILFRIYEGEGVSSENAILTYREEYLS
jgi:hypothetical protein